ncbi:hypothetical protein EV363DRAFT_1302258 [Boletus edulis]|nr:hypothetical protein EV363DRAFT_1302258 [Boletus edulis]
MFKNSSTTAIITSNGLVTPHSPPPTNASTSGTSHTGSSSISSHVTSTTSGMSNLSTANEGLDASHSAVSSGSLSPIANIAGLRSTSPATMTPRSTTSASLDHPKPSESTSSTLTAQSEAAVHVSSGISSVYSSLPGYTACHASSIRATFSTNHEDHRMGTSTSDPALEPTSRVPALVPTSVSSVVDGVTVSTKSPRFTHAWNERPTAPQQSGSWVTIVTSTQSGTILQTTMTLESVGPGSLVPVPTASRDVHPNSSSTLDRQVIASMLSLILGTVLGVLGVLGVVALAMTLFRCRARRRSKFVPNTLSCDFGTSRERRDRVKTEATPRLNHAVTRKTSCRPSLTPEHIGVPVCESFQSSNGQPSNPFSDSSTILSSRTSMSSPSIRSVDSVSTGIEFALSVDSDTQEVEGSITMIDASASSLELQFATPFVAGQDSSIRLPYLSRTWHYDSQSATAGEYRNEEGSKTSHVASPAPSKPFALGTESARLRLRALLKEARRD